MVLSQEHTYTGPLESFQEDGDFMQADAQTSLGYSFDYLLENCQVAICHLCIYLANNAERRLRDRWILEAKTLETLASTGEGRNLAHIFDLLSEYLVA